MARRHPSPRPTGLKVESLEAREMLSAAVTAELLGDGTLRVTGTATDDFVVVRQESGWVAVEGISISGTRLLENYTAARVTRVEIDAGDGNDVVELHAPAPSGAAPVLAYGGPGLDLLNAVDHPGQVTLHGEDDDRDLLIRGGPQTAVVGQTGLDKTARLSAPVANPVTGSDGTINALYDGRFGAPRATNGRIVRFHEGIDVAGHLNQQWVLPVAPGRVVANPPYDADAGYRLIVNHDGGFTASYMHLAAPSDWAAGVRIGDEPGPPIGYVGRTGNVPKEADPHLHLRMTDTQTGELLIPNITPLRGNLIYRPAWADEIRRRDELVRRYNEGVGALAGATVLDHIDGQLRMNVPVLDQSMSEVLELGPTWAAPFQGLTVDPESAGSGGVGSLSTESGSSGTGFGEPSAGDPLALIRARLESRGFAVEYAGLTPDARGDLLRARGRFTFTKEVGWSLGGEIGFDYFDGAVDGELAGRLKAGATPLTLDVTFGIDLAGGTPSFWIGESSRLGFEVRGTGTGTGNMGIGSLVDVDVTGTATANLAGGILFDDPDNDGKVRLADLGSAGTYASTLTGSVGLTATFTTTLVPLAGLNLPPITWTGSGTWTPGQSTPAFSVTSAGIDAGKLLKDLALGLFSARNGFDLLGPIAPLLNADLDGKDRNLVGGTLMSRLGIAEELGWLLTTVDTAASDVTALLSQFGIQANVTRQSIDDLILGKRVDLLSFHVADGDRWAESYGATVGVIPVPFGTVNISTHVSPYVGWGYEVGLGIDTTGFYIDSSTHVRAYGGVRAGVRGSVKALGFLDIAEAEVGVGVNVAARVGLKDPDPSDGGRIYLDEIQSALVAGGFRDVVTFSMTGELTGYARVELTPPWPLPDITLFCEEFTIAQLWGSGADRQDQPGRTRSLRKRPLAVDQALPPEWLLSDGTLLLQGDERVDRVALSRDGGTVVVDWAGRGRGRYDGSRVQRVRFLGNAGNDRLDVADGFAIPIEADGGAGDDTLHGGSAADALRGRTGNDVLRGGGGDDDLRGDDQDDLLDGGAGRDTLVGGTGHDEARGGADPDVIDGGADDDHLSGGGGNDTLGGGLGRDVLAGGADDDTLSGGEEDDQLSGDVGNDALYGQGGNDRLDGGAGNDRLLAGAGDDWADGGTGNDVLEGETGADVLDGGDNDDLLRGGDQDDDLWGGGGADWLEGGAGNDQLHGGAGADVLLGGEGNDRLNGDGGRDRVEGEGGEDILAIDFASAGDTDDLSGGPDRDWLAVAGTRGDDRIELSQTGPASFAAFQCDPATGAETGRFSFSLLSGPMTDLRQSDIEQVGIDGGAGHDQLVVRESVAFDVTLWGRDGNDTLQGGRGFDRLDGGTGDDLLTGGAGNDELHGGAEQDTLDGGAGSDRLYGGENNDSLAGGGGRDLMYGDAGNDTLRAGPGIIGVLAYGGPGHDSLFGGDGVDNLSGGEGNDLLVGGDLLDVLAGGRGRDTLIGGAGADFLYGDTLGDFDSGAPWPEAAEADTLYADGNAQYPATPRALTTAEFEALVAAFRAVWAAHPSTIDSLNLNLNLRASPGWTPEQEAVLRSLLEYTQLTVSRSALEPEVLALELRKNVSATTPEQDARLGDMSNVLAYTLLSQVTKLPSQTVLLDTLDGGRGPDVLRGSGRADVLSGGEGDDAIYHSAGADVVSGGTGDDTYTAEGTDADEVINIVAIERTADGSLVPAVVINGAEATRLNDTDVEKIGVDARGGNDRVTVRFGNQAVRAVVIDGGAGHDVLDVRGLQTSATLRGGDGDDTLYGTDRPDTLDGGYGHDRIEAFGGADVVYGGGGNDTAHGGEGNDSLYGGAGADTLHGDGGDDWMYDVYDSSPNYLVGGAGNDTAYGGAGNDSLYGGAGNDYLNDTYGGNNLIVGEAGDDLLYAGTGTYYSYSYWYSAGESNEVYGGDGNDRIYGHYSAGTSRLDGGAGSDVIWAGAGRDYVAGGDGDDTLRGDMTPGGMSRGLSFDGGAGNDSVHGSGGADWIHGGAGSDKLYGLGGNDVLYGDYESSPDVGEADTLDGGAGADYLWGGGGSDLLNDAYDQSLNRLEGQGGNDTVYGGFGNDTLSGGTGNDYLNDTYGGHNWIYAGDGDDVVYAGTGTYYRYTGWHSEGEVNTIWCGAGNDTVHAVYSTGWAYVYGEAGNDTVYGSQGNDVISGGNDHDTLWGNRGSDVIYGDAGHDLLVGDEYGGSVYTGGNDSLYGGLGSDQLHGGWGDDCLNGGYDYEYDLLLGQWGRDRLEFYYGPHWYDRHDHNHNGEYWYGGDWIVFGG